MIDNRAVDESTPLVEYRPHVLKHPPWRQDPPAPAAY
jgi:hypothetical protein